MLLGDCHCKYLINKLIPPNVRILSNYNRGEKQSIGGAIFLSNKDELCFRIFCIPQAILYIIM
jgi:hypothetical protein